VYAQPVWPKADGYILLLSLHAPILFEHKNPVSMTTHFSYTFDIAAINHVGLDYF